MSVIQKALAQENLKLEGDTLPADQRTCRVFKRLIAAVRAAEAEVMDELDKARKQTTEALRQNLILHEKLRQRDAEVAAFRLVKEMGLIEGLSGADRKKLLAACRIDEEVA